MSWFSFFSRWLRGEPEEGALEPDGAAHPATTHPLEEEETLAENVLGEDETIADPLARPLDGGAASPGQHHWVWVLDESIPSEPDAAKRVLEEVIDHMQALGWDHAEIFGVHLSLEEALVNAMKHGNGFDPDKQVHVLCQLSAESLHIEIEDEGPGFRPQDVPDPTDPENLENPSGRGLMLMRNFMSSVGFNETGNRVIMDKKRGS